MKNIYDTTPLHVALENPHCNKNIITILTENGAKPSVRKDSYTPLHLALKNPQCDDEDIILVLIHLSYKYKVINNGVAISGDKPLDIELSKKNPEIQIITKLCEFSNNETIKKSLRKYLLQSTPLVANVLLELLKSLLAKNEDIINMKDNNGNNALYVLIKIGTDSDIAIFFRETRTSVSFINAQNENHSTLLHLAVSKGYEQTVKELVAAGANINAVTIQGNTPLHLALLSDNINESIIKSLLENDANMYADDNIGVTPFQLFKRLNYESKQHYYELLKKYFIPEIITNSSNDNINNCNENILRLVNSKECSICIEKFNKNDIIEYHEFDDIKNTIDVFHENCLRGWLIKNSTCPNCRKKNQTYTKCKLS